MSKDANEDWKRIARQALDRLDIRKEYEELGLIITGERPNDHGWLACKAFGRADNKPSAAINVGDGPARGRYIDSARGDRLSFWDFVARVRRQEWRDVRNEYLGKLGLNRNRPKTDDVRPEDKLRFSGTPDLIAVRGLLKAFPGVTLESLLLVGARTATYPKRSSTPRYVVAIPAFGVHLLDADPTGYVIMAIDGGLLLVYRGKESPPSKEKRITLG
jgi:hypothetical protein